MPNRAKPASWGRRDPNFAEPDEDPNDKYESFFEFEDELMEISQMKPAREFQPIEEESTTEEVHQEETVYLEPESIEEEIEELGCVTLEEEPEEEASMEVADEASKRAYTDVVGFKFVQCGFIKEDGERCKRQAPKGKKICSIHQRVIDKRGQKK